MGKELEGYADFGGKIVRDEDVYKEVKKRLKFTDRFNMRKIVEASLLTFTEMAPTRKDKKTGAE